MPCPVADAIPAEELADHARQLAGSLSELLPPDAIYTRPKRAVPAVPREGFEFVPPDGPFVYVATTGAFDVRLAAPEPLDVSVRLDPGGCLQVGMDYFTTFAQVEGATVTVRVAERTVATWTLGRTMIEATHGVLVLRAPGGPVAFDLPGGRGLDPEGAETVRALVEVPALRGWFAMAPALAARLGPAVLGEIQAARRAIDGGAGDPALAGARLLAGPGVAGARVWVDGLDLGAIDAPLTAPVGGLVNVRWEGTAALRDGGVEAALGPGVDLELRADGSARVVARPKGPACFRNGAGESLRVSMGGSWGAGKTFSADSNPGGPDGAVTVAPARPLDEALPLSGARAVHPGLRGDYTFTLTPQGVDVAWAPSDKRSCGFGNDAGWPLVDLEGRALYPVGESSGTLLTRLPYLTPLADQYLVDQMFLVTKVPTTVVTPDTHLSLTFGREAGLSVNPFSWGTSRGGGIRIEGAARLAAAGIRGEIDLWDAELQLDEKEVRMGGLASIPYATLCDGTVVTAHRARFTEEEAPSGPKPGKGPHVVRDMGLDRARRLLWFVVEPAPGWPVPITGLPIVQSAAFMDSNWYKDLSTHGERVVTCPLPR